MKLPHEKVFVRLFASPIHGVGVIAIEFIPAGTRIWPKVRGEKIRTVKVANVIDTSVEMQRLYRDFCPLDSKKGKYFCPASFNILTPSWYVNDSKTPNIRIDREYEFFALRDIKIGEELTVDYSVYSD
jgi:SET domain-containing protein